MNRRDFFSRLGDGLHGAALASLLAADLFSPRSVQGSQGRRVYDQKPRAPHFDPTAKSVIHLFMNGGPSQVDLFDPKPALKKFAGGPPPRDILTEIESLNSVGTLLPSPFEFAPCGECGMEISEMLPHLREHADDLTLIRSMHGEHFNHEPSLYLMHSGRTLPGRPSLGSWAVYALGTENQNLPGYVVLDDPKKLPVNGIQNWQSGWLPPVYQGTRFRSVGPPVLNLQPAEELPSSLIEAERSLLRGSTGPICRSGPISRGLTPGSPAMNWPPECNWRRPTPWTFRRRAKRPETCTASTTSKPNPTAGGA